MPLWFEILLRSGGLFFLVLVLMRIMGKRNPAHLTPFQFVNYIVIAVIVSLTAVNIIENFFFGLTALGVFVLLPIILDYLSLRSKAVHDLVQGKETVLVVQGKVMEENLKELRLTGEELLRELRRKEVFNLGDVEFAVMEPTGDLNVMLKSEKTPVTSYDLGHEVSPRREPQTVILDGNVLNDPLKEAGVNSNWLQEQLEKAGVTLDNIFIGQVDGQGELYLDLFDDSIQLPQPGVKEALFGNLEKAQAEMESYSLETDDQEARELYEKNAGKLKELMGKLEPYLLR
ncbi:MAG: DUF421 domain-containing protein [Candidatus Syntrophonatronum acetioxidans]|uniref:DUF421 domain-containing protein n=1 Tax=Candidatus Syntrophonatronum acetioxidans TaxID=1795816 RepID=A0A424Y9C7_9FIRM|nr:MAG: DUF421 domain-containing protein [Candidatus Syntrophonatronum acetioxidans]